LFPNILVRRAALAVEQLAQKPKRGASRSSCMQEIEVAKSLRRTAPPGDGREPGAHPELDKSALADVL
jgi:hypothetical protein